MDSAFEYFKENIQYISDAVKSIDKESFDLLIDDCKKTLSKGKKIVISGLGKNVPICEKFVGTMISLGLDANFLHTNSAIHGDMGMIHDGDLVIVLSKSGKTIETIQLISYLKKRKVEIWLITFNNDSILSEVIRKKLVISLEHEGDLWNIIPNNSTTINLLVLQTLAIQLSKNLNLSLDIDFKPNHPGGNIGEILSNGKRN